MDGITLDAITWPFPTRIETGLSLRYDCPEDIDAVTDNLLEAQDRAEGRRAPAPRRREHRGLHRWRGGSAERDVQRRD